MHGCSRRNAIRGIAALAAGAALAAASRPMAAEPAALAIKGYDPVAYFVDGRPVRGRPEIEYEWDENRYRFATAEHRDLFRADPVRYAPQFANFCAMSLAAGELITARARRNERARRKRRANDEICREQRAQAVKRASAATAAIDRQRA